MGRRRSHGGRAFAWRTTRLLRRLAANRRSGGTVAQRRRRQSVVVPQQRRLLRLGLAHCLPAQRGARRHRPLYPAAHSGNTGVQSGAAAEPDRGGARRRAVSYAQQEYPPGARRPLHRGRDLQHVRRLPRRLSHQHAAYDAADRVIGGYGRFRDHDRHAADLRPAVGSYRTPQSVRHRQSVDRRAVVSGILADGTTIAAVDDYRGRGAVRFCLSGGLRAGGGVVLRTVRYARSLYRHFVRLSVLRNLRERTDADRRDGAIAVGRRPALADLSLYPRCQRDQRVVGLCDDGSARQRHRRRSEEGGVAPPGQRIATRLRWISTSKVASHSSPVAAPESAKRSRAYWRAKVARSGLPIVTRAPPCVPPLQWRAMGCPLTPSRWTLPRRAASKRPSPV